MKNILIVATQPQRFLSQLTFARSINNLTKEFKIYFFIGEKVSFQYRSEVNSLEFDIINNIDNYYNPSKNLILKNIFKKIIKKFILLNYRKKLKQILNKIKYTKLFTYILKRQERIFFDNINNKYEKILKLVKKYNISTFLINGDRHLGYEPIFLKLSKTLNISSIIVYLALYAEEEQMLLNKPPTKKIKPNIFTSSYIIKSQNNLKYKVVDNRFYYNHPTANALNKFGVLTTNPYVMGSGYSNILCLPNNFYKNSYIKKNVNKNKIRVVGDTIYDHLYKQLLNKLEIKKKIIEKYNLDKNKKIFIFAPSQLAEHFITSWERHWKDINFLIKTLCEVDGNILISLHPKMDRSKYKFLENQNNCKILNEPLSDVLPTADMFIAGFSSTIIWSVLCGIRTIIVDTANLRLKIYDFLKSVKTVNKEKDLKKTFINFLHSDVNFDEDWISLSRHEVFDGKVLLRYINLIKNMDNLNIK